MSDTEQKSKSNPLTTPAASIDGEWVRKDSDFASGASASTKCVRKVIADALFTLPSIIDTTYREMADAVISALRDKGFEILPPPPNAPEETKIKSLSLSPLGNEGTK